MGRKPREETVRRSLPAPTFGYAQVEAALAKIYAAEDVQKTAFRGRLKHFRKLGIPEQNPGKGTRITYSPSDVFQLLICLELAEFGIDPHLIVSIVRRNWAGKGNILPTIELAQLFPGDDFLVAISAHFMSWTWNRKVFKQTATSISMSSTRDPVSISILKASDLKASDSNIFLQELQEAGQRFFIFNLSARVRAVEQFIKECA